MNMFNEWKGLKELKKWSALQETPIWNYTGLVTRWNAIMIKQCERAVSSQSWTLGRTDEYEAGAEALDSSTGVAEEMQTGVWYVHTHCNSHTMCVLFSFLIHKSAFKLVKCCWSAGSPQGEDAPAAKSFSVSKRRFEINLNLPITL